MDNSEMTKGYLLTHKMDVQLYVLRPPMMNRICREIHCRDIVTEHNCGLLHRAEKFTKKLAKPTAFSHCICHRTVFSFGTGSGDDRLPFGRPRNETVAKVDTKSRS
jgi:hypothetical protein